jgi:hypothetical protein
MTRRAGPGHRHGWLPADQALVVQETVKRVGQVAGTVRDAWRSRRGTSTNCVNRPPRSEKVINILGDTDVLKVIVRHRDWSRWSRHSRKPDDLGATARKTAAAPTSCPAGGRRVERRYDGQ